MPKPAHNQQRRRRRIEGRKVPHSFLILDEGAEPISLQAAASDGDAPKLRRFSMSAYTGGKLMLGNFYHPVVVDLSGIRVTAKSRPILRDHNPAQIVGHTDNIVINAGSISVEGTVSAANEYAREVVESSDNGFPWQASIGAAAKRMVFVDEKETVEVNGRKFTGPLYVARQSTLGEVSFVALGADDNTSARMVASAADESSKECSDMSFENWIAAKGLQFDELDEHTIAALRTVFDSEINAGGTEQPVGNDGASTAGAESWEDGRAKLKAEAKRINAINAACAKHPDIAAKAIDQDWSVEFAQTQVELAELRAARPTAPNQGGRINAPAEESIIRAALYQAVRVDDDIAVKECGEQAMEAAHKEYRGRVGLKQLILEAAWSNGFTGRQFAADDREMIRAAFSTMTLTNIFADVANKKMLMGFESNDDLAVMRQITAISSVSDFKQINSYRLTGNLTYEKVSASGELRHGKLSEDTYTNQADTYGIMYSITRKHIIDDDLNALDKIPYEIGIGGADKLLDVFWTEFLDNSTFFATGNSNYVTNNALGVDSLTTVETLFLNQTKPNGKPLGTRPRILLVPPALNNTAGVLMTSNAVRDTTANTKYGVDNPHVGKFTVLASPYLSNSAYTGYSALAWYLLADPQRLPVIETVFLNGKQSPTVESADAAFNVLGIDLRGYHDFGCNKQEYRGGAKSKGEA